MGDDLHYRQLEARDFDSWVNMGLKLWNDYTEKELKEEFEDLLEASNQNTFVAEQSKVIGFINVSIRRDYVGGADYSPTGYIEGIYVEEEFRQHGVARSLISIAEKWMVENDCKQIGSDTWVSNKASQAFHKKVGFKEEEILVHFIKDIKDN